MIAQNGDSTVRQVWTSDEGTMAWETARIRWPPIVQDMIDDVTSSVETEKNRDLEKREAGSIRTQLEELKRDIIEDKDLKSLPEDGTQETSDWNQQLAQLKGCSWHSSPWLFAECYLYRRVHGIFEATKTRKDYDCFKQKKDSTFVKSRAAVEEMAARYIDIVSHADVSSDMSSEAQRLLFIEMTEIALWGNATDLSLLNNLSLDELKSVQGRDKIASSQKNIVDNDVDETWNHLSNNAPMEIDIVLDNAGFEFFTDLLYATYLLETKLASKLTFHVKDFPWFVSDVTPSDVGSLFAHVSSSEVFPNQIYLDPLMKRVQRLFDNGYVQVNQNPFWTTGFSFHAMPEKAPSLFEELKKSGLVIFKGDLNYRKLTDDRLWPYTTTFKEGLGPIGEDSGMKILALRTNKADVCVGVESEEKVRQLEKEAPKGAWVRNGKYAVISFSDGK